MKLLHARLALAAITGREVHKFLRQPGRLASSLVRPLLWMVVFAAGFRQMPDLGNVMPFNPDLDYRLYMVPGLALMVCLFNGMQSSLAMVYDREMGVMRLLLTAPLPRGYLLACKLAGGAFLSVLQALAYMILVVVWNIGLSPWQVLTALPALVLGALMLSAFGLMLSVYIKQLENFAGTMNFVIFPMFSCRPRCIRFSACKMPVLSGFIWSRPSIRSRTPSKHCAMRCTEKSRLSRWRWS